MKIEGSVALVTGASRGLGRHFVEQLLSRGAAKVYAAARHPDGITLDGVIPLRIDLTDQASIDAAAEAAGDITLLVNNAGVFTPGGVLSAPMADIHADMDTNYYGTLAVTRAFAPHLIANAPAAILNVLSVLAWLHPSGFGAYAAAKAAVWAQTDVVREELASHGVDVTALHVGFMDTDMTANIDAPKEDPGVVAALALDGVEHRLTEVLADERSRDVKSQLSLDRGAVTSTAPAP